MKDYEKFWYSFAVVISLIFLAAVAVSSNEDAKKWEKFKVEHNCKITQKMNGETIIGTSTSGNVIVSGTSAKAAWTCDDGITYWKED